MKLISELLFTGVIGLGAVGAAAYGQGFQPAPGVREAVEKACAADTASLCAGKAGRDAAECLRAAGDKVSPGCTDALSKMGGGGAGGPGGFGGAGGPAGRPPRAPPSEGGTVGTVDSVAPGTIEITMSSGQKATVLRSSHTKYLKGTGVVLGSTIKAGDTVLVLGIVNDIQGERKTDIDASQVIAAPLGVAFVPGSDANLQAGLRQGAAQAPAKKVGQVPADYVEGEGTIVGPAEADKAILAALSAYPTGLINRAVKVNNDIYEVHHIGVAWPHHIFITTADFKYVGAF